MTPNTPVDPNFDFGQTEALETFSGKQVWHNGIILRKVPSHISKTDTDVVIPIPVFYDPENGQILDNLLPPTLRPLINPDLKLESQENPTPSQTEFTPNWGESTSNNDWDAKPTPQQPEPTTPSWGDTPIQQWGR